MDKDEVLKEIKTQITEKNVNLLIGSGASVPFFPSLGNIEVILTDRVDNENIRKLIYLYYFKEIIEKNIELIDTNFKNEYTITTKYRTFIRHLSNLMNTRNSRISPKRLNIFTTNYDVFFERSIDLELINNPSLILNDGGNGYFKRYLSSENFHKTVSRNGVFDNYQKELLTINLIKCHGSVTWKMNSHETEDKIEVKKEVSLLKKVKNKADNICLTEYGQEIIKHYLKSEDLTEEIEISILELANTYLGELEMFFNSYKELMIINPEKSKFENTVVLEHYYSMLRLLSYELEKDQTILIVFGFSFADEHVRNMIKRSLHNPSLRVYVFVYKHGDANKVHNMLNSSKNINVQIIEPNQNEDNIDFETLNELLF